VALRTSEIVGYLLAIPLANKVGRANGFSIAYWLSSVALVLYLVPGQKSDQFYAFCVLLANFGVTLTFTPLFLLTESLFKAEMAATVFGLCNLTARGLTVLAPILAETGQGLALQIFLGSTLLSGLVVREVS
jgi:hypothetical protein